MRSSLIALAVGGLLLAGTALAQPVSTPAEYQPQVGQAGKDVVWVPMPDDQLNHLLDMAKVTTADVVMDLGSGDGRNIIAAAKRGVRALGRVRTGSRLRRAHRCCDRARRCLHRSRLR